MSMVHHICHFVFLMEMFILSQRLDNCAFIGRLTVGAQTSRFSSVSIEVLKSLLCMRFKVLNPSNPAWAYLGNFSIATNV